jgi:hypothetical protein
VNILFFGFALIAGYYVLLFLFDKIAVEGLGGLSKKFQDRMRLWLGLRPFEDSELEIEELMSFKELILKLFFAVAISPVVITFPFSFNISREWFTSSDGAAIHIFTLLFMVGVFGCIHIVNAIYTAIDGIVWDDEAKKDINKLLQRIGVKI